MKMITSNDSTRRALADAIADVIEENKHLHCFRVQTGTVTLAENSPTLTIPRMGRMIHVFSPDVDETVGHVTQVSWNMGPNENQSWQLAVYTRYDLVDGQLKEKQASASAFHSLAEDTIEFGTGREDRFFKAGATYVWVAFDWENGYVKGCYDVSDPNAGSVKLILLSNGDGTYAAHLRGTGATKDFEKEDVKPWAQYIDAITSISVGDGITSIGNRLFHRHEAVCSLHFENCSAIKHLGEKAFQGCQFGGEFSFPNLEDVVLSSAFSHCTKLRGLTFNTNVTEISTGAFTGCLNLRYVYGLGEVSSIGVGAFINTPKMERLDITPMTCVRIEESAFRLSGAMRYARLEDWPNTIFERDAIPAMSFVSPKLDQIRAVVLPHIAPNEVNPDGQYQYADIDFATRTVDEETTQLNVSGDGCMAMAFYHLYNWFNGAECENFRQWWYNIVLPGYKACSEFEAVTISDNDINDMQQVMAAALGWRERCGFPVRIKDNPAAAKSAIVAELAAGRALVANFAHYGTDGSSNVVTYGHSVAIIGSNSLTDKLIVADSTRTSGNKGCVYEMSFEQLFGDFDTCIVRSYVKRSAEA